MRTKQEKILSRGKQDMKNFLWLAGIEHRKVFCVKEKNVTRIVEDGKILKYNVNEGLSKHRKNGKLFY